MERLIGLLNKILNPIFLSKSEKPENELKDNHRKDGG